MWIRVRSLLVVPALTGLALLAAPASAVTIDWVIVGNAGNAPDTASNCRSANCGSVGYEYYISRYEVTNAQYAEFLNAVAASDPLALYSPKMGSSSLGICTIPHLCAITRSGADGGYTYTVEAGFEDKPVFHVSFYDALRFANWLNNGQGSGDTETGAYTITVDGITNNTITRNPGATTFLPSENEWYKAAYYSPGGIYFDYPIGTDTETSCVAPESDTGNSANCDCDQPANCGFVGSTDVGVYGLSPSPYGTFDQGGNVAEWNEQIVPSSGRGLRGGSWTGSSNELVASFANSAQSTFEFAAIGFRVASLVPEPDGTSASLLTMTVLAGLAARQERRKRTL
jgi:formylglycine-generating enzyme required for sulfatase activity